MKYLVPEELIGLPHANSLYPGVSGGLAFCATTVIRVVNDLARPLR